MIGRPSKKAKEWLKELISIIYIMITIANGFLIFGGYCLISNVTLITLIL